MKGGVLLNFILANKEELVRDVKVRNKEGMRQIAGSQPWTSCSGICLEESLGKWPWRQDGFSSADRSSGIASFMLKNGSFPCAGSQAKVDGGLRG